MKAIDIFLDGIEQMYLNSVKKVEKEFKRKLTKQEKELVAENFILRLKNHLTKKAEKKDAELNEYYLTMETLKYGS